MAPQRHLLIGILWILGGALFAGAPDPAFGKFHLADPEAAKRGQVALTSRAFTPASFTTDSLATVWRIWTKTKPLTLLGPPVSGLASMRRPTPMETFPWDFERAPLPLVSKALRLIAWFATAVRF